MISIPANNLSLLIEKSIQNCPNKAMMRELLKSELAKLMGYQSLRKINGIINGSYQMTLTDAVAICKFFEIERLEQLLTVDVRGDYKSVHELRHEPIQSS